MEAKIREIHGLHYCGCAEPRRAHCEVCGEDYCQDCGGVIIGKAAGTEPEAARTDGDKDKDGKE